MILAAYDYATIASYFETRKSQRKPSAPGQPPVQNPITRHETLRDARPGIFQANSTPRRCSPNSTRSNRGALPTSHFC